MMQVLQAGPVSQRPLRLERPRQQHASIRRTKLRASPTTIEKRQDLKSDAELFTEDALSMPESALPDQGKVDQLQQQCRCLEEQVLPARGVCLSIPTNAQSDRVLQISSLRSQLDELYREAFSTVSLQDGSCPLELATSAAFGQLGREQAEAMQALIEAKKKADPAGWQRFQSQAASIKLQLSRAEQQLEAGRGQVEAAAAADRLQGAHGLGHDRNSRVQVGSCSRPVHAAGMDDGGEHVPSPISGQQTCHIVLLSGFESFNIGLYRQVSAQCDMHGTRGCGACLRCNRRPGFCTSA